MRLWHEVGRRPDELRAIVARAMRLANFYRLDEAAALLGGAVDAFADLAATAEGVAVAGQLARVEMLRERHQAAVELADSALRDAEALGDRPQIAELLITKGSSFTNLGRTVEGQALMETGVRIADEDGLVLTGLRGRINLAANPGMEPRQGFEIARAGIEIARRIGHRRAEFGLLGNYSFTALTTGAWDELLADVPAVPGGHPELAILEGNLLQVRALRGEPLGREALEALLEHADPILRAGILDDVEANVALVEGRHADAIRVGMHLADESAQSAPYAFVLVGHAGAWSRDAAALAKALDALEATRVRGPELDAARIAMRAAIAALDGRRDEAMAQYRDAFARYRAHGLRLAQMLYAIDVATVLGTADAEARGIVEEARSVMTELRAAVLIERLDAALATHGGGAPTPPARAVPRPTGTLAGDASPT
jgi:hypothetical protein